MYCTSGQRATDVDIKTGLLHGSKMMLAVLGLSQYPQASVFPSDQAVDPNVTNGVVKAMATVEKECLHVKPKYMVVPLQIREYSAELFSVGWKVPWNLL